MTSTFPVGARIDKPIEKVAVLVNCAAGGVGPSAPKEIKALLERFGLIPEIYMPGLSEIPSALKMAVGSAPDLLVVLAGDGTARAAAALCGPDGPLIAPLPGGTMNLLPHALYGHVAWPTALSEALAGGIQQSVGGGSINGVPFYVAAILGPPALWAPAREAVRRWRLLRALRRTRLALRTAFTGRLRLSLDGVESKASALMLICPSISKTVRDESRLEAIAVDPFKAGELVRVGFRALAVELFGPSAGDWRDDPILHAGACHMGFIQSKASIPAVLDGEPMWFPRHVAVTATPNAFRALAGARY